MKEVIIRPGTKHDTQQVFNLIYELAVFEKAPEQVTNTVEQMLIDGYGDEPCYKVIVAEVENKIVGIALTFIKYSTWKGKGVFLEDLIVTENMRGHKIGKLLFEEVISYSKSINAKQLHWQVLDWNTPAIDFYKKYNAEISGEWLNCKMYF
ncbi:MAG: GNAT family N-acetyltransferase [Bacteroidia bacterium]